MYFRLGATLFSDDESVDYSLSNVDLSSISLETSDPSEK